MAENKIPKSIVNEIHRKVGRLILLFQKIELILKDLIARNHIVARQSELMYVYNERLLENSKCTLGNLINFFSNSFYKESQEDSEGIVTNEILISYDMSSKSEDFDGAFQQLKSLVDSRNFIVHNLLEKFETETIEQCIKLELFIDDEFKKAKTFFEELSDFYDLMAFGATCCESEDFKNFILNFSKADDLSRELASDIFESCKREDGWAVLHKAENLLREQHNESYNDRKLKYGYKSIIKIMELSNLFKFRNETISRGGFRILYRLAMFNAEN